MWVIPNYRRTTGWDTRRSNTGTVDFIELTYTATTNSNSFQRMYMNTKHQIIVDEETTTTTTINKEVALRIPSWNTSWNDKSYSILWNSPTLSACLARNPRRANSRTASCDSTPARTLKAAPLAHATPWALTTTAGPDRHCEDDRVEHLAAERGAITAAEWRATEAAIVA